ncbi:MAG: class I SAM-dependent DNA methyltransferase [Desulfobacterales bacterium]|jgi:predicted TPR repeat methyltransferase
MMTDNPTLKKVYTARNSEELMNAYKDWAANYENDTVASCGYVAHIASARALDRVLERSDAVILDAGCGTGLVGEALRDMGYERIDALDYSPEMLKQAERKRVYRRHIQADLSRPLEFGDNVYDAVVCTGTFTYGHVKADAFAELIRITRPGGYICFTIREGAYEDYGYRQRMLELEQNNAWELLSMQDEDYFRQEKVSCKLCTYVVKN